jgi:ubiquinone/menaquinone biosynthesis C-methylase UbiE
MLNQALARAKHHSVVLVQAEAEFIPLADKSVDVVLCKSSYHHFGDRRKALAEIKRVARNAAVFVEAVTPCSSCVPFISKLLTAKEPHRETDDWYTLRDLAAEVSTIGSVQYIEAFEQRIEVDKWIESGGLAKDTKEAMWEIILSQTGGVRHTMKIVKEGTRCLMRKQLAKIVVSFDRRE